MAILGSSNRLIVPNERRLPSPTPTPTTENNPTANPFHGPNNTTDKNVVITAADILYLRPHFVPIIPIAAGVTKNAKKAKPGTYTLIAPSITPIALTKAVSTIALVFVLFINHHSYIRRYINWYLLIITV